MWRVLAGYRQAGQGGGSRSISIRPWLGLSYGAPCSRRRSGANDGSSRDLAGRSVHNSASANSNNAQHPSVGKTTRPARSKVEDVVLVHRVGVPGALIRAQQRILLEPGVCGVGQVVAQLVSEFGDRCDIRC
jgi:hypothetical protein